MRRLVQGQNRQGPLSGSSLEHYQHRSNHRNRPQTGNGENGRARSSREPNGHLEQHETAENTDNKATDASISSYNSEDNHTNHGSILSDGATTDSDNISTIPLKSMVSSPSTRAPSVLSSDINGDNSSYVASTAETSLAPSIQGASLNHSLYPNVASISQALERGERDRDEELIITLASSSRRTRRRSLDTNCSTAGIPPASIVERLTVNPTAGNSSAASVHYERGDGRYSGHYERSVRSEAE